MYGGVDEAVEEDVDEDAVVVVVVYGFETAGEDEMMSIAGRRDKEIATAAVTDGGDGDGDYY